MKHDES